MDELDKEIEITRRKLNIMQWRKRKKQLQEEMDIIDKNIRDTREDLRTSFDIHIDEVF